MLKKIVFAGLGIALLATPLISSADTLSDLQAQIQALMAQLNTLQTQNQTISTPPTGGQADDFGTGTTNTGVYCPKLSTTLQRGSRDATTGGQVSELQSFLTDYYNLNENIVVGGFFGNLTQSYVVKFQTEQGLPTLGIVGSLTRAKIASVCGTTTTPPSGGITVTAPNGGQQWEEGVLNSITWAPYNYNPNINPSSDVMAYLERPCIKGDETSPASISQCEKTGFLVLGSVIPSGKASIHWMTGFIDPGYYHASAYAGSGQYGLVPPGQYYVEVVNRITGASDRSDAPFTITPKRLDLKVNGSDGPVTINPSQSISLSWSASPGLANCYLTGNISAPTYANYVANVGSATYTSNLNGLSQGVVTIACRPAPSTDTSDPYAIDASGNGTPVTDSVTLFASGVIQPTPSIQVLSPNGGEQLNPTQPMGVRVAASGISSLSIALYKNDQWLAWFEKQVPPNGSDNLLSVYTPASIAGVAGGDGAIYKIYATGQKADGTGYVDDKSDAPFSFTTSGTTPSGSLTVSTDASSPSYQIVAGGTMGVTLGVLKFHATGEAINLTKIGLTLTSGNPADVTRLSLYSNFGTLLGTATFAGTTGAVSVLSTGVNVPANGDANVIVKADIASIGVGQPATPGDLVRVNVDDPTQGVGVSSGAIIRSTGSTVFPGVRIYRSYPTIALAPLSSTALSNGQLMRFTITAAPTGGIGLDGFRFNVYPVNMSIGQISLYAYTDASYSTPINAFPTGYIGKTGVLVGDRITPTPTQVLEIPAGQTYYFELRGSLSNVQPNAVVATTLVGDTTNHPLSTLQGDYNDSSFIWTPNDTTTSGPSDIDWTNGYAISTLPLNQTLTAPVSLQPTVSSISPASGPNGTQVTIIGTNFGSKNLVQLANGDPSAFGTTLYLMGDKVASSNGGTLLMLSFPPNTSQPIPTGSYRLLVCNQDVSYSLCSNSSVTFTVTATQPQPTATLTQTGPSTTVAGTPFTLSWGSTNASSCTLYKTVNAGAPTYIYHDTTTTGVGTCGGSATSVNPGLNDSCTANTPTAGTHYWNLTCTGAGGTATAELYHTAVAARVDTSCTYSPTGGVPSTINIDGGSSACSSWCSSQAMEANVRYSCSYAGAPIASALQNANLANTLTALEAVLKAILAQLGQ